MVRAPVLALHEEVVASQACLALEHSLYRAADLREARTWSETGEWDGHEEERASDLFLRLFPAVHKCRVDQSVARAHRLVVRGWVGRCTTVI